MNRMTQKVPKALYREYITADSHLIIPLPEEPARTTVPRTVMRMYGRLATSVSLHEYSREVVQ